MEALTLSEQLKAIKRSFVGMMNGVVATSMRNKGVDYKVNFGVELPRLQAFAEELPHTVALASALWKEQSRECRLLAPMLMPVESYQQDLAELWMEQVRQYEEADVWVFSLLGKTPFASTLAFRWMADERELYRYTGYALMAQLFTRGMQPSERDAKEILDQCATDLQSEQIMVKKAAYKTVLKYMRLGDKEMAEGEALLERLS